MAGTVPESTSLSRPKDGVFPCMSRNRVYGTLNISLAKSSQIYLSRNVPEKIDRYAKSQGITYKRVGNANKDTNIHIFYLNTS